MTMFIAPLGRLRGKIPQKGSLGQRAMTSTLWSMGQIAATYALRLGSNLLLTRLLLPEAFGLMAMAMTVITALQLFSDVGIDQSIVREKDAEDPHFLRVVWTMRLIQGLFVSIGVLICAALLWRFGPQFAPAGTVYADPRLPGLIAFTALGPLLTNLQSLNKRLFERRLDLRRATLLAIGAQALSLLVMSVSALIHPTVWVLFFGLMTTNLFNLIGSYIFFPGAAMGLAFDRAIFDRLWGFGRWILISSAFTFVQQNADKFILASLLGSSTFGLYIIAMVWVDAGRVLVGMIGTRVGFPALGEVIRTRPQDLSRVFRKLQMVIDTLCISGFLICLIGGHLIIRLLYSDTYDQSGHFLQILALCFLSTRFAPVRHVMLNFGESRAMSFVAGLQAVGVCLLVPLGNWLAGIEGAMVGYALVPSLGVPFMLSRLRPHFPPGALRIEWIWVSLLPLMAVLVWMLNPASETTRLPPAAQDQQLQQDQPAPAASSSPTDVPSNSP